MYLVDAPEVARALACACDAVAGRVSTASDRLEKFFAKSVCALSASSTSATFDNLLVGRGELSGEAGDASALELLLPFDGGGEVIRVRVSKLDAGLWMPCDAAGAGRPCALDGRCRAAGLCCVGDAARKVRSVMEPLLSVLLTPGRPATLPPMSTLPLPCEDVDPRLTMRFVWRLPTGSGEVVWERRAAAAAAEESEALLRELDRLNTELAAIVAAEDVFRSTGCFWSVFWLQGRDEQAAYRVCRSLSATREHAVHW